jgi:hypothetical protein
MKVDFIMFPVLEGESIDESFAIFIGIRVSKCKFDPVLLLEGKGEGEFRFIR